MKNLKNLKALFSEPVYENARYSITVASLKRSVEVTILQFVAANASILAVIQFPNGQLGTTQLEFLTVI